MTEAVLDIKQWGNNRGVRLPAAVALAAHLQRQNFAGHRAAHEHGGMPC